MTQQIILEKVTKRNIIHEALIHCSKCDHIVPRTVVCLYCGVKILDENLE